MKTRVVLAIAAWMVGIGISGPSAVAQEGKTQGKTQRYRVVMPDELERFLVREVFQTDEMRWAAVTPGTSVHAVVQSVKKRPLLTMPLPEDHRAVANHPAYYGVLVQRPYEAKFVGDLYHLHELFHIGSIAYRPDDTFPAWAAKMIDNEKDASLYTEAMVYFEFPQWRRLFPLKKIWVDRFLDDPEQVAAYQQNRLKFRAELKARFVAIGKKPFQDLDEVERRSWIYDRWNTIFTQTFAPSFEEIETRMFNFSRNWNAGLAGRQGIWLEDHLKWLDAMTGPTGVLNEDLSAEFLKYHQVLDLLEKHPGLGNLPELLGREAEKARAMVEAETGITMTPEAIELLNAWGVTGTVYSVPYLETKNAWTQFQAHAPQPLLLALRTLGVVDENWDRSMFELMFAAPYLKRQDLMHQLFIKMYRRWSRPVLRGLEGFKFAYPSAGSIEAMKDTLGLIKSRNPDVAVHVFRGEYEGVVALAQALSMKVVYHDRGAPTSQLLAEIRKGDYFYLSQPSSLDGNVWVRRGFGGGYTELMRSLEEAEVPVIVDLAYVGTVAKPYLIDLSFKNIQFVFFSLSKAFGVYYQRIGGVFCREEHPLMRGHIWFKNVPGVLFGTHLMQTHAVQELPRRYQWAQHQAVMNLQKSTGLPFEASDVILLAHTPPGAVTEDRLTEKLAPFRTVMRNGVLRPALSAAIEVLERGARGLRPQCELYFRTENARN